MSTETSAPAFTPDREIAELVVPVGTGALHDRAMPFAAWMSGAWDVPIRLLHVSASVSSEDPDLEAILQHIRSWHPELPVEGKHLYGDDPAVAISQEVGPHMLPVLSTEHADGWSFKDSVAEALVHHVGVPLVLVGPEAKEPHFDGELVVGLDGTAVAESALAVAATMAKALGKHLWMVRVVSEPAPDEGELHPEIGLELQRLADSIDPAVDPKWEVIHSNDPVGAIEGLAERLGAAMLVTATRGRTDESRTSMCSITMGLVSTARRPVLVVHADRTPMLGP
jgi:nucleotide-binding universal stress UspA family protein